MRKKKILALFLSLTMLFAALLPAASAAEFNDTAGHWAEDVIGTWSGYGVLLGSDGSFRPNDPITRAEMATVLNRVIGYTATGANSFADVSPSDWFYQDVLKLNKAGVMLGSDGLASPQANITREQAAVMIARAFGIAENASAASAFPDAAKISSWATGFVGGMRANGYVSGDNEGNFNPLANITRAEAVKMLDNIIGGFYNAAGEYTGTIAGNVVIKTSGVTLKNATINGDLYIMEGVGNGNVILDSVKVTGKTFVRGGGANSIIITGDSELGDVVVDKAEDGTIRVTVSGNAVVNFVVIDDGLDGVILEGNFGSVEVDANVSLALNSATVGTLTVNEAADVVIDAGSTVATVNIAAQNTYLDVAGDVAAVNVTANSVVVETESSGSVGEVNINANNVSVEGEGNVGKVAVNGGTGNTVTTADTEIAVAAGAGAVETAAGEVAPGETGNSDDATAPPSDGGSGGDSGGDTPAPPLPPVKHTTSEFTVSHLADLTFIVIKTSGDIPTGVTVRYGTSSMQAEKQDSGEWRCVLDGTIEKSAITLSYSY